MTTQEQESAVINKAFETIVDSIYTNFISLYAQAANDQEREIAQATFQRQITKARVIRDLAISLLPA